MLLQFCIERNFEKSNKIVHGFILHLAILSLEIDPEHTHS